MPASVPEHGRCLIELFGFWGFFSLHRIMVGDLLRPASLSPEGTTDTDPLKLPSRFNSA